MKSTRESLTSLIALKPKTAIVVRNGRELLVDSDEIIIDDIIIVKPGEKFAADA